MNSVVGCAGQSEMGQVQFRIRFCSIRVVKYSFQQDYGEGMVRTPQVTTLLDAQRDTSYRNISTPEGRVKNGHQFQKGAVFRCAFFYGNVIV